MEEVQLIVLIHGLFGNPSHMESLAGAIARQLKFDRIVVLVVQTVSGTRSFDGIDDCAKRIFCEMTDKISMLAQKGLIVKKISFIGYSLGGLFARAVAGLIEENNLWEYIDPVLLATFASPHAGSQFFHRGLTTTCMNALGRALFGQSGKDLFGQTKTLDYLSDPSLPPVLALRRFRGLYLFANAVYDRTVPFWTAYISTKNPFTYKSELHLVMYEHKHLKSGKALNNSRPFLINCKESRFEGAILNPRRVHREAFLYDLTLYTIFSCLMPFIVIFLCGACVISMFRRYTGGRDLTKTYAQHVKIIKELYSGKSVYRDSIETSSEHQNLVSETITEAAGEVVNSFVGAAKYEDARDEVLGHLDTTSSPPEPMLYAGTEGLLDSFPDELPLPEIIRKRINNLNTLPWHKYAVKLHHLHSHAEIVDRKKRTQQGQDLVDFFASLVSEFK